MTHQLILGYGLHKYMKVFTPNKATDQQMINFHLDKYINYIKRVAPNMIDNSSPVGNNPQKKEHENFNVGENDCPCFPGLFEFS